MNDPYETLGVARDASDDTIRKACQTFLRYDPPLAGVIRRDTKVRDTIRAQTPLLTRSPQCDAADDVTAIAAQRTF